MAENKGLTYKGHPLMRKDNLIYYGSMADSHIVMLQILKFLDSKIFLQSLQTMQTPAFAVKSVTLCQVRGLVVVEDSANGRG